MTNLHVREIILTATTATPLLLFSQKSTIIDNR